MVFDTMVLAYALLGVEPFREDAVKALGKSEDIVVPDFFFVEFTNVLWQWVRTGDVVLDRAVALFRDAETLVTEVVAASQLRDQALEFAVARNVSAYDTFFVALAVKRGSKLVSSDRELLRKFPEVVIATSVYARSGV